VGKKRIPREKPHSKREHGQKKSNQEKLVGWRGGGDVSPLQGQGDAKKKKAQKGGRIRHIETPVGMLKSRSWKGGGGGTEAGRDGTNIF